MCVRIFCDYCCCCSVVVSVNPIDIFSQMKIIHFNNYVPLISVNMSEKLYFFSTDIAIGTACTFTGKTWNSTRNGQACKKCTQK